MSQTIIGQNSVKYLEVNIHKSGSGEVITENVIKKHLHGLSIFTVKLVVSIKSCRTTNFGS